MVSEVVWYLNGDDDKDMSLVQCCPEAARVASPYGALKILMDLDAIVEKRKVLVHEMGWTEFQPSTQHPDIRVIVDNYAQIFPQAPCSWSEVVVEGHKLGICVEARGDDTSLEAFGYSDRLRSALGKVPA